MSTRVHGLRPSLLGRVAGVDALDVDVDVVQQLPALAVPAARIASRLAPTSRSVCALGLKVLSPTIRSIAVRSGASIAATRAL